MKNFLRRVKRLFFRSARTSSGSHRNPLTDEDFTSSLSSPKLKHIHVSMSSPSGPGGGSKPWPAFAADSISGSGQTPANPETSAWRRNLSDRSVKPKNLGVNPGAWRRRNETIARFFKPMQIRLQTVFKSQAPRPPGACWPPDARPVRPARKASPPRPEARGDKFMLNSPQ